MEGKRKITTGEKEWEGKKEMELRNGGHKREKRT